MVELGGFKNVASARACFAPIMKKLMEGGATPGAAPAPKKAVKRAAPKQKDDGGDTNDGLAPPTKKARGRPRKTTAPRRLATPEALAAGEDVATSDEDI